MFLNDLSILMRLGRVFAERRLSDTGLGCPEQMVIVYLVDHEPSNQDQIARFFDIDKGAIAKTVAKLEAKGLVISKVNERDRREKTLSLTPAAHGVKGRLTSVLDFWERQVYQGVSEEDRRIVERSLALMARNSHAMIEREG